MSTYSFLMSNFFWLTASRIITRVVSVFSLPIITYYLSPEDFGIIAMFSVVQLFLGSFFGLGIVSYSGRVIYKYERTDKEQCKKRLGLILIYLSIFSVLGVLISAIFIKRLALLLLGDILVPDAMYYYIPIVMAFLMSIYGFCSNLLLDLQLNRRLFYLEMTQFILFLPAQLVGLIYFRFNVWDVIVLQLVVQCLVFFYGLWLIRDWLSFSSKEIRLFKEAMTYSLPMVPLNFAGWIQDRLDKVFLNRMISINAVGIYTAGVNLASQYSFISRPITTVIKPELSKRLDSNDPNVQNDIKDLFTLFFQFSIFLYLIISLFSRELVTILLNVRFHECYRIVPIFLLSIIFSELTGIFHLKFIYKNKTIWFPITLSISCGLNVVLNILLIPKYDIYGASVAKTLSELSVLFITYAIVQRLHKSEYRLIHNFIPLILVILITFTITLYPVWNLYLLAGKALLSCAYVVFLDIYLRKYNMRYNDVRAIMLKKVRYFFVRNYERKKT